MATTNDNSTWIRALWSHLTASVETRERVSASQRIQFIDAVRAYAILSMLIGHVVGIALAVQYRVASSALYQTVRHIEGSSAPVFVFAAGLVVSYLLFKDPNTVNIPRAKKSMKRGFQLVLIGFIIQISISALWRDLSSLDARIFEPFYHSHILHTIGFGIVAIACLYLLTSRLQAAFLPAAFVLANIFFLAGPYVRVNIGMDGVSQIFAVFLHEQYAYFPLVPWLGFTLFGACTGYLAARKKLFMSLLAFLILIVAGYYLRSMSWYIYHGLAGLISDSYADAFSKGAFTYYRFGEVVMITGIVGVVTRYVTMPSFFLKSGQETLSIYVLHCVVVYGSITDFGINKVWYKNLDPIQTGMLVFTVTILFIVYALYASWIREKIPPLRFIK